MTGMVRKSCRNTAYGRAAAAGLVAMATGVLAAPALADDGAGPAAGMGLTLDAGAQPPGPGQELTLRATLANGGGGAVEGALLAQHVPESLEIVEVGGDGVVKDGIVNWRVAVPAGEETAYTVRVRVPEDAEGRERLTSTACLLLDRDSDPAMCASDTVVVAETTVAGRASEYMDRDGLVRAAGVALLAGLAWALWRRRSASVRG
ncbi:hypothetical protein HNR06_003980 [Nocardiopsis arvandica]|uniref:DUF11 domain-containing protein n=1 Tax=Nocardiopsis sinuspersici TaxID=501010 RepID=A0A7Z0BKP0_9ACTN|nr:hypothetical protein [Nocardiopsis sinuspersici]